MNEDWGILLGHALFAMRFWEEDILTAEIEELEKLDASETYPRRLNAKEVLITQKDGELPFAAPVVRLSWCPPRARPLPRRPQRDEGSAPGGRVRRGDAALFDGRDALERAR